MTTFMRRQGIQLCQPWSESNFRRLPPSIFVQPKLNGGRCRVEWHASTPILLSSEGNILLGLDHITDAIKNFPQLPLDGEIYVHGWSRERIHSAMSRKVNASSDAAQLQFHVFDLQLAAPQSARLQGLLNYCSQLTKAYGPSCPVVPVSTTFIPKSEWLTYASSFIDASYEGIILRHPEAIYLKDKRPWTCIKFKPTETDTYKILAVLEAISIEGVPKGMIGAFTVTDPEGNIFNVSAGKLTHNDRIYYWNIRETLISKFLVVKHEFLRTTNSVPVAAVAVSIAT